MINNFIMQQASLQVLFPEISQLHNNPLTQDEFSKLSYFSNFGSILPFKEFMGKAEKSYNQFQMIKVKKGTVLYEIGEVADRGYILLSGCIQVLHKKNTREKTEQFPGHVLHSPGQKITYLRQKFNIQEEKAELLLDMFYEEKILFKYLPYIKLTRDNEFGFGQMMRNTLRCQTVIAVENSELLFIKKREFDLSLRDFHFKKQNALIEILSIKLKGKWVEELKQKYCSIMNTAFLLSFHNEDIVFQDDQYPNSLFYIIEGEVELRKDVILKVPEKFTKNQNKNIPQKHATIKLARLGKSQFIGQYQIFYISKSRLYSTHCIINNALILKIDPTPFLKVIDDFPQYQKQLLYQSKQRQSLLTEKFQYQEKRIKKSFQKQYEENEANKQKEKIISNYINHELNNKNQMFQVFSPEGVFFRDTFQKLEGFDLSLKEPQKQKIKQKKKEKQKSSINKISQQQNLASSPKRILHPTDFLDNQFFEKANLETVENTEKKVDHSVKKYRSVTKFHEIKKDQQIYKRVLIKNGRYNQDKRIDKSNSVKPLIHRQFDGVIKECITRKNLGIKKASQEKQKNILLENYKKTVDNLNKMGSGFKFSRFATPCKGTEQMRKRMKTFHKKSNSKGCLSGKISRKQHQSDKIEDCIGFNSKPKSSEMYNRSTIDASKAFFNHSPEKFVLLNHMMKPMTYYNFSS